MKSIFSIATVAVGLAASVACGGTSMSPSTSTGSPTAATVGFNALTADGTPVTTYTESGFTVSALSGDWTVRSTYGSPAPFIQFSANGGTTLTGEVQIRAVTSPFYFKSIDFYSSTTPIPYTIRGIRSGTTVFTVNETLPNTFGNFRTVISENSAAPIDTLSIVLTNSAAACCPNPMGLDTIVFTSAPTTAPPTFSLNGQVTDSGSGAGISGAAVAVVDGPNAGRSTTTDGSGNYSLSALQQAGFTVRASAGGYDSQSKGVTLTSNQTTSFQLTRQAPAPPPAPLPSGATVVGFNGLTTNGETVSTYSESGFTVAAKAGDWVALTTYGNPAPFIQFVAGAGTTVTGEVQITAGGAAFTFYSVDLYSSTTRIPYTITGLRSSSTVFVLTDTLPNTFGNFRTVANPNPSATIDTLAVALTNAATLRNPMGLDSLVLKR